MSVRYTRRAIFGSSCDNEEQVSSMEQRKHNEVEAKLHELARTHGPGELMDVLYDLSRELLDSGYPREALLEDFKHLIFELRERGDDEREDAVMEVLDVLTGWCAPSTRL